MKRTVLIVFAFVCAAVCPLSGMAQESGQVRTSWLASDYHLQARRTEKTVREAELRVRKLYERSQGQNLVVLEKGLLDNIASLEALYEMTRALRVDLENTIAREDRPATDEERIPADNILRQMTVLKDRSMALYSDSQSFFRKLTSETKQNKVTRLN